jgi:hypothetical protein
MSLSKRLSLLLSPIGAGDNTAHAAADSYLIEGTNWAEFQRQHSKRT